MHQCLTKTKQGGDSHSACLVTTKASDILRSSLNRCVPLASNSSVRDSKVQYGSCSSQAAGSGVPTNNVEIYDKDMVSMNWGRNSLKQEESVS
mmetsp:Transcript_8211/g.14869  ORF Transcript_8211/g.14869 Transcript_8211/m.14869 type:complete len:93 (+) Transcript_8211:756-1034(+)